MNVRREKYETEVVRPIRDHDQNPDVGRRKR
jgi:hypothetical protein